MHPDWSLDATLYELNTRQFTEAGTFGAAEAHLPRLAGLGVDIIWLMPIHPIGEKNRKGSLGSPYSVRDYFGVNPEFGTLDDLKRFIAAAHALGMHVILDWVANHTAWDNPLVAEHPEWYARDAAGQLRSTPWWDWSDVVDLDFGQPGLRRYMLEAMSYWVREADIDGFRCDVAGYVPGDFWDAARSVLDAIRPVFMLAEWEARDLHDRAFDATYAWTWNDALHAITRGAADTTALVRYYSWREKAWPPEAMRMTFIANHDTNSWKGTQFERFGKGLHAAIALSVVGDGIPLLYCGQEAGNEKRLAFFEKDPIVWREHPVGDLYRRLFGLKHGNTALWNAPRGALMEKVPNSAERYVFSFVRANERDGVFAVFNLSAESRTATFAGTRHHGRYLDVFGGATAAFTEATALELEPWTYRVYTRERS